MGVEVRRTSLNEHLLAVCSWLCLVRRPDPPLRDAAIIDK